MEMTLTPSLSERQWQIAHIMAQQLVLAGADANELGKANAYLRAIGDRADVGEHFLQYLETLARQGDRIGHSQKTKDYYAAMREVCREHLQADLNNAEALMQIVGWVVRLMRYYKEGMLPEVLQALAEEAAAVEVKSDRQAEIAQAIANIDIAIGTVLEAIVTSLKTNEVTYTMLGSIPKTVKKTKKDGTLAIDQSVKVEVISLNEDGSIKKIKRIIDSDLNLEND